MSGEGIEVTDEDGGLKDVVANGVSLLTHTHAGPGSPPSPA